jgi:hypothetical protein
MPLDFAETRQINGGEQIRVTSIIIGMERGGA